MDLPALRLARPAIAALVLATAFLSACATGRPPREAPWRPDVTALLARGDTAGALALLDSVAWRRPRDVAAIHALGMLAWDAVRPTKTTDVNVSQRQIRLLRIADSSLRWAARSAPDSARYAVDLGRWFLYGNMVQLRVQAEAWFNQAIDAGRRTGGGPALADALDEAGMIAWRSHENMARRRVMPAGTPSNMPLADLVNVSLPLEPIPGLDEAEQAIARFREALAIAPWRPGPARHLAMGLAEWDRWEELARFADEWTRGDPANPIAWASAGLAAQRTGNTVAAQRHFDSLLVRQSPAERDRWTRVSRLMKSADSARYTGLDHAERAELDRAYWEMADPVTLTPENEIRTEFLARVAFAELRWSSEDFDNKGADTDRGDIHVRFGPPPVRFTLNSGSVVSQHVWWYPSLRLGFNFGATVAYGTAHHGSTRRVAEEIREVAPARWENLPVVATLDTVLVQVSRFRASAVAGDSSDVVVFAHVPIDRMARGIDIASGPVETRFLATDARGRVVSDQRSSEVVRFARPDAASMRAFRTRIGAEALAYRVEAWQETAGRAARALASTAALPARGFGTSDILVADRVVPRDSASAGRWTDLRLLPSVGVLRVGQPFGVAWETYDLAVRDGQARYEVSLELVLVAIDRSFLPRPDMTEAELASAKVRNLAARVLGGIGDIVGVTAEGDARVTLRYTRARGAAGASLPAALDWLTLELGDAPRGRYELALTVRDLATGQRTTTTRLLRVVP